MKKNLAAVLVMAFFPALAATALAQGGAGSFAPGRPYRMSIDAAAINAETVEVVRDERLDGDRGFTLKAEVAAAVDGDRSEPDLTFAFTAPEAGEYTLSTYAVVDDEGAALMDKARGKYDSLFMKIQIDQARPTQRVVYVPWHRPRQVSGKFALSGEPQELKIWLPRGVRLGYIEWRTYVPPAVPAAAQNYEPAVVPPPSHPRLWVNQQTLPQVRAGLQAEEHRAAWEKVSQTARTPFEFKFDPDAEVSHNAALESAAEAKAFYYLMTGDEAVGREAVQLMSDYLSRVEFGNILDITREIGRAIYTASLVYDWCYPILGEQRQVLYDNLMRLASEMETGWPPFRQSILTGHGAEAQINRDLLSMSIAIYDENPQPYQYTSFILLETLVPMRAFEFQSPRYNQGVNYGAYRFAWEMHAAWLLKRMSGKDVFHENIKDVRNFWMYMRMPDGQMLRDGDGFNAGRPGQFYYWKSPLVMLLNYAYSADPIIKGEFQRQGGLPNNPVLFLLLNDPQLQAEESLDSLPLTKDFGPILGSMVARTGWDISLESNDVVAEIKGGGYHFGNHQQSDAGSLQIYYRGLQVADLGTYRFYGTPYDVNFNKRSIAHSMMLARDPSEKFHNTESNDGGTRYNQQFPRSPEDAKTNPQFQNGTVLWTDFGPSKQTPSYSYFKVDLTSAYSAKKMEKYTRGFCFLNLQRDDIPAAIILTDDMTTTNPEFQKYWQINTLNPPKATDRGVILHNRRGDLVGKTHVQMLVPQPADRQMQILSGAKANSSFEHQYEPPASSHPEANGHRIMISPKQASARDRFVTVFQMVDGDTEPLSVDLDETGQSYVISLADRVVSVSKAPEPIAAEFTLRVPAGQQREVLVADLQPGHWEVKGSDGQLTLAAEVTAGENTLFFEAAAGEYTLTPR